MKPPLLRRLHFAAVAVFLCLASPADAAGNPRFDVTLGGGLSRLSGELSDAYDHGKNAGASVAVRTGLSWLAPRIVLRDESFNLDGSKLSQATPVVQIVSGSHRVLSGVTEVELHLREVRPVRPYFAAGLGWARVRDEFVSNDASRLTGTASHALITSALGLRLRPDRVGAFAEGRWSRLLSKNFDFSEYIRTSFGLTLGIAIRV